MQQPQPGPVKLFVGQVPSAVEEPQLKALFEPFGFPLEVAVLRDRASGRHKGCAFVTFGSQAEGDAAIHALNGQRTIAPQTNPLQVRYAESPPAVVPGQGEAHSTPTLPALMGMGLGGGMFPGFPALANLPVSPARPGKKINHPCRGGRKVFVGQFPRNTTKDDLQQLFEEFGVVEEVFLFKDRLSGQGKGAAFVMFSNRQEADAAIDALHNKRCIPPMKTFLQVRHADGEVPPQGEPKLFVGMIPFRATEDEVRTVFQPFGPITEVTILHKASGQSQGAGFIRFETRDQCDAAIAALDGKHRMPGSPNPLMVRYAAAPKPKQGKQTGQQKVQQQQAAWLQAYIQQLSASAAAAAAAAAASGVSPYHVAAQQSAYLAGLSSLVNGTPAIPAAAPAPPPKKQPSGPPGANLFVLHIPFSWADADLKAAFSPFGPVLSAMVFCDRATGTSKGFGFVSYTNPAHATAAIAAMNNHLIGTERLLVQLKTEKQPPTPRDGELSNPAPRP
eukprot:EG_transcript_5985